MKHLLTLTLITFAVASAFAGDAPVDPFAKAPFNVKKALTDYEKDLLKAKENYAKEVEKIQNKAIASLSAEVANAFKKGDTTLGSELVKKIEAIKAESVTTDLLGNVIVGDGNNESKHNSITQTQLSIVGKWEISYIGWHATRKIYIDKDLNVTVLEDSFITPTSYKLSFDASTKTYLSTYVNEQESYKILSENLVEGVRVKHKIVMKRIK